jgi:phosphate transport system permease protein
MTLRFREKPFIMATEVAMLRRSMSTLAPSRLSLASRRPKWAGVDWLLHTLAAAAGLVAMLMLASLVCVLLVSAMPSIRMFGASFLVDRQWRPNERQVPMHGPDGKVLRDSDGEIVTKTIPPTFGALPVIYGTAVSSAVSLLLAVPLSLGAAIFLIRIAPRRLGIPVSFLIEFLAAIPSIAFGIWALFVLVPFLQHHLEPAILGTLGKTSGFGWMFHQTVHLGGRTIVLPVAATGRDMLSGSMVLAIMIIPIITAIARDVLRQVPPSQLEGTVALGATWWQSSREMLHFARGGIFGAIMLGLARAAGETMAITMVIGNNNQIVPSLLAPAQTMSSLLATEFSEASLDIHRAALCEVALVLLAMSLTFNVVARRLVVGKNPIRAGAAF